MLYELSERARSDVKAIILYTLENFGRQQADEYVDGLYKSFDLLTDNPKIGMAVFGDVRRYVYRSHYVFYAIRGDVIRVATIRHARQELPPEWKV